MPSERAQMHLRAHEVRAARASGEGHANCVVTVLYGFIQTGRADTSLSRHLHAQASIPVPKRGDGVFGPPFPSRRRGLRSQLLQHRACSRRPSPAG